jgi:hypothetical protein
MRISSTSITTLAADTGSISNGGANRIVLDDVGRVTPGGALIKQINIVFVNLTSSLSTRPCMFTTRRAQAAASATSFTRRPFRTFRTAHTYSRLARRISAAGNRTSGLVWLPAPQSAGMVLSPNP